MRSIQRHRTKRLRLRADFTWITQTIKQLIPVFAVIWGYIGVGKRVAMAAMTLNV